MEDIINRVIRTIDRNALIVEGEKVLIGFSGGPDSVALLHILHGLQTKLKFSMAAVYINHKLRPRAAKKEIRFSETTCRKYDVPFYCEEVDIPQMARNDKTGIEETARIYRYRTLETMAARMNFDKIAVGHHRDDRAETVIFNLLRGSGRMGVAGIPPRRGKIIRPLYDIRREAIADFLEENGLKYMTDRSNYSRKYTRNRIRRRIIPLMKRLVTEAAVDNIIRYSEIIAEEERFLGHMTAILYDKLISITPGGKIRLDLSDKLKYDTWLKRRLAFKMLVEAGFIDIEFAEVEKLVGLIDGERPMRISIRGGLSAETAGNGFYIFGPSPGIDRYEVIVPGRCRMDFPRVELNFEYVDKADVEKVQAASGRTAYIDAEKVEGNLYITGLKRGAKIRPFGRPGSKKAGDFLTDQKYPRPLRDELPVLYDQTGIVWLAGLEIDHRVRVRDETRKTIKIELGEIGAESPNL